MTRAEQDELFQPMCLTEFCKRSSMPRSTIERYLAAAKREDLLSGGRTLVIRWEWLEADLPAFSVYLEHNFVGRSEPEIAARADIITGTIWEYANSRKAGPRVSQELRRIRARLLKVQAKTSPDETGDLVSAAMRTFPYLEAEREHSEAVERVGQGKPRTVSAAIAVVDLVLEAFTKRRGPRDRSSLKNALIEGLAADLEWLTGRKRRQHGSRFREFAEMVLEGPLNAKLPDKLRNVRAATLIR